MDGDPSCDPAPPDGSGRTAPRDGSGRTAPPDGSGRTAPRDGSGRTAPPDGSGDLTPPATPEELDALEARLDAWLRDELETSPVLVAVDRGDVGQRRWYVRLAGEDKEFTTIWLTLGQRALHLETYVMPAPEEDEAAFYAYFLRRNRTTHGLWFAVGEEEAVFLVGQLPIGAVGEASLDRLIGSTYAYVERVFRPALAIGFATRLAKAAKTS